VGLAVFQLVLLANVARSMMKFGPQGDGFDVDVLGSGPGEMSTIDMSDDIRGGA
jgi:hypothetical protein